jgi:hypothetical protein
MLWSDGAVTFGMGAAVPGVGVSRGQWSTRMDLRAGEAALPELELFDAHEIGTAVRAARALFRGWNWAGRAPTPGYLRHVMHRACAKRAQDAAA